MILVLILKLEKYIYSFNLITKKIIYNLFSYRKKIIFYILGVNNYI